MHAAVDLATNRRQTSQVSIESDGDFRILFYHKAVLFTIKPRKFLYNSWATRFAPQKTENDQQLLVYVL